ncbi:MAG: malto-oligosyltrehalose synthase, partial [Acidimicrobiia bacterium]
LKEAIDAVVLDINRQPDQLDSMLNLQNYRLMRWRAASQEMGYRRFFDIDTLIGLRVEDPAVFIDSHRLTLRWVTEGEVDGLRIDHPDGLRRPGEYLRRLREAAPRTWIVVEKILGPGETLPDWPVEGTTGYEFLNDVTRLFVDTTAEKAMTALWEEMSGSPASWDEVVKESKMTVLREVLAADLNRLGNVFSALCEERRRYRDFTRSELADALAHALAALDVYRTYVTEEGEASEADRARIDAALSRAVAAAPDLDPELFELLGAVLVGKLSGPAESELRMRFQQLSGSVMAKGVEDTAFYRYLRLAALCEVGGDPGRFGEADPAAFHERRRAVAADWPTTMLALSTHDTKRSEDVRARLSVLSEIPDTWAEKVRSWHRLTEAHRPGRLDGATEYLIYQTLIGAHPIGPDRLVPYLEKATKEARVHTSWTDPDPEYDRAVESFVRTLGEDTAFQDALIEFTPPIVQAGRIVSLAQKALQLTAPGVPDIYQGTELWDLSLVDPDNRRPVDHAVRRRLVSELNDGRIEPSRVLVRMEEGLPKLWLTTVLLDLRRRRSSAFGHNGDYAPLSANGSAGHHVVAYRRGEEVAVVVPRLLTRLARSGGWAGTTIDLPKGEWRDVFSGNERSGTTEIETLLEAFPVSVLERVGR